MTQVGPQTSNNVLHLKMDAHTSNTDNKNSKSFNQLFTVLYFIPNKETLKPQYFSSLEKRTWLTERWHYV